MRLWWDMFWWFGTPWAMSNTVKELMFHWKSGHRRRKWRAWNLVLLALIWVVLREKQESFWRSKSSFSRLRSSLQSSFSFGVNRKYQVRLGGVCKESCFLNSLLFGIPIVYASLTVFMDENSNAWSQRKRWFLIREVTIIQNFSWKGCNLLIF